MYYTQVLSGTSAQEHRVCSSKHAARLVLVITERTRPLHRVAGLGHHLSSSVLMALKLASTKVAAVEVQVNSQGLGVAINEPILDCRYPLYSRQSGDRQMRGAGLAFLTALILLRIGPSDCGMQVLFYSEACRLNGRLPSLHISRGALVCVRAFRASSGCVDRLPGGRACKPCVMRRGGEVTGRSSGRSLMVRLLPLAGCRRSGADGRRRGKPSATAPLR